MGLQRSRRVRVGPQRLELGPGRPELELMRLVPHRLGQGLERLVLHCLGLGLKRLGLEQERQEQERRRCRVRW